MTRHPSRFRAWGESISRALMFLEDSEEQGQPPIPASLVIMSEIDTPLGRHLDELARLAGPALDATFGLCEGYPAAPTPATRIAYLRAREMKPEAAYVNTVGRPLQQIRREATLRARIEDFLDQHRADLPEDPRRVRTEIQRFVREDPSLRWAMRRAPRPSLRWRLKEGLHAVAGAAGLALAAPLVLLLLPFYAVVLRLHERLDSAPHIRPSPEHAERLAALEDFGVQNQFSAIGYVKPGDFPATDDPRRAVADRLLRPPCLRAREPGRREDDPLRALDLARRLPPRDVHQQLRRQPGGLQRRLHRQGGLRPERVLQQRRRLPADRFLFFEGARREQEFKDYLRRHQIPTQVFYSAYDQLSALNIENNALIRSGLPGTLAPAETEAWLRRL